VWPVVGVDCIIAMLAGVALKNTLLKLPCDIALTV
jgi:hypothetical protein